MDCIFININIPDSYYQKAKYVFSIYSLAWGIPISISRDPSLSIDADICYTVCTRNTSSNKQIVILFDESLYEEGTRCFSTTCEGFYLWGCSKDAKNIDLVASTYRLLNFLDETQVRRSARDNKGIFRVCELPFDRAAVSALPVVEQHAEFLLKKLIYSKPELNKMMTPRWPDGKTYAISLTHDTDATNIGSPKEIITNAIKLAITQNSVFWRMCKDGVKYLKKPNKNPYFSFHDWGLFEKNYKLKSCFYLSLKPRIVRTHINDCKSDMSSKKFNWGILKRLAEDGWEFGVHPSIHSKDSVEELRHMKNVVEQHLGLGVRGLRHHYWALNWFNPFLTFRNHAAVGFDYDSSIAWRDQVGFRAGTCLPFQPFDRAVNKEINIYELPTSLMDGHIMDTDVSIFDKIEAGIRLIETVKKHGGGCCFRLAHRSFLQYLCLRGLPNRSTRNSKRLQNRQ